eukprot:2462289-Amphidinium_carterae.1
MLSPSLQHSCQRRSGHSVELKGLLQFSILWCVSHTKICFHFWCGSVALHNALAKQSQTRCGLLPPSSFARTDASVGFDDLHPQAVPALRVQCDSPMRNAEGVQAHEVVSHRACRSRREMNILQQAVKHLIMT